MKLDELNIGAVYKFAIKVGGSYHGRLMRLARNLAWFKIRREKTLYPVSPEYVTRVKKDA